MSKSVNKSDGLGDFSRRARSLWSALAGKVEDFLDGENPDNDQPLSAAVRNAARAYAQNGGRPDEAFMHDLLTSSSHQLGPMVKRHLFPEIQGVPEGLTLGWVQWPRTRGRFFSLGVFTDRSHFVQVALADDHGRVFVGQQVQMDVQNQEPAFMLGREQEISLPYGSRFGRREGDRQAPAVHALQGGIVGRDQGGNLCWLASWLRYDGCYTLEQLRPQLPPDLRFNLEYRDAVAISFFTAYLLPHIQGVFTGFGSGNIFHRLNREAPMGAIRRSVQDTVRARSSGQRVSGLEDLFSDLMREAGALNEVPGLEAVHGAEPLHLYASSYSGAYFLTWDNGLEFSAALRALQIEGNLNRFASVSAWLERNASLGIYPNEDTVTRVQAARLDQALMDDPAIAALLRSGDLDRDFDPVHDDGRTALNGILSKAAATAAKVRQEAPQALPVRADQGDGQVTSSEWVYRQTFSMLIRSLRLPFRFDVEFRSNLEEGQVAIAFTSAGRAMMPTSRYDDDRHAWVNLDDDHRAAMSADYNLRVGLIMAALAFGVDPSIRQVSLQIDSIGLEEAVDEQNSAIRAMMGQALEAFERMRSGDMGSTGSKADPKDGDVHGDPTHPIVSEAVPPQERAPGTRARAGEEPPAEGDEAQGPQQDQDHGQTSDDSQGDRPINTEDEGEVNREFKDLIQGVDLDETAFARPSSQNPTQGSDGDADMAPTGVLPDHSRDEAADQNPMSTLQSNPTVRNLVTVTFSRELFLSRIRQSGITDPKSVFSFFDAAMEVTHEGGLAPVDADFDMRDERFSPRASQEEPEFSETNFTPQAAQVLGVDHAVGLSIQRADLLQRALGLFHELSGNQHMSSAVKAQEATRIIKEIADPELDQLAPLVASAMIDETKVPDFDFALSSRLDKERIQARDLLFSGATSQAIQVEQAAIDRMDAFFSTGNRVPRYFNSYAERVVYNRLFATPGEQTLLIPDNLFYAHLEIADVLSQLKEDQAALQHLNAMVAYAPAYPLSHLKLAVLLANREDWDSARAATLNALRVALDRDDASFAYYRLAYASWMRDEFDVAAAAYIMSEHISPDRIPALKGELAELRGRAHSQCMVLPEDFDSARAVLAEHGLPVWPHTEVAAIVRDAARVCVDGGMFVPARTLSMAAARMNDDDNEGVDVVQAQFMRSLNA